MVGLGDEIGWAVEYALTIKTIHSLLLPMLPNLSGAQYYRRESGDNICTAKSLEHRDIRIDSRLSLLVKTMPSLIACSYGAGSNGWAIVGEKVMKFVRRAAEIYK